MGILFDIANLTQDQQLKIATRAAETALERTRNLEGCLKKILEEEIQKEIGLYLTDQSIDKDADKTFNNIITPEEFLDNEWDYIKEH